MDALKGVADVVEHILYETLGLLLPGVVVLCGVAAAFDPGNVRDLLDTVGRYPWLFLVGAYLTGYIVQGISRPAVTIADSILSAPGRLALHIVPKRARESLRKWESSIGGRHAHVSDTGAGEATDFKALINRYWSERLGLTGPRPSDAQVRDLCFSEIAADRRHLDRYRAATSFCRGCCVAVLVALPILAYQLLNVNGPAPRVIFGIWTVGAVAFYALLERADMYDRLWRAVVPVQFLCTVTKNGAGLMPPRSTRLESVAPSLPQSPVTTADTVAATSQDPKESQHA